MHLHRDLNIGHGTCDRVVDQELCMNKECDPGLCNDNMFCVWTCNMCISNYMCLRTHSQICGQLTNSICLRVPTSVCVCVRVFANVHRIIQANQCVRRKDILIVCWKIHSCANVCCSDV